MQTKTWNIAPFILLISFGLLVNCGIDRTEKNDPESRELDQEQEQQIRQERNDTTTSENPIFEASLESTNKAKENAEAGGTVMLTLKGDSIHIKGEFTGLSSDYTDSYIHRVLQADKVLRLEPSVNRNKNSGTWRSTYKLDNETLQELKADSLYISVYSTEYKEDGEIRGQITSRDSLLIPDPQQDR